MTAGKSVARVTVEGAARDCTRATDFPEVIKGAVHDFMGDFDVLHLVFCLAYMHKSAFID